MFKQSEDIIPASLLGPGPKINFHFPMPELYDEFWGLDIKLENIQTNRHC